MRYILTLLLSIFIVSNASAASSRKVETSYLTVYGGAFSIFNHNKQGMIGGEFRGSPINKYFVPKIGVFTTSKKSVYGYVGLNLDFNVYKNIYVIPSVAIGAYGKHKGRDLGGVLEFRPAIEVAAKLSNNHRLGLALSHISNARTHAINPGEEDLTLTYSIPLSY